MLSIESFLPLYVLDIRLKWLSDVRCPPFHQPLIYAWLRNLIQWPDEISPYLCLDTPESSRIEYQAGNHYQFRIVLCRPPQTLLDTLFKQLAALPLSFPPNQQGYFANNLCLEYITDVISDEKIKHSDALTSIQTDELTQQINLLQQAKAFHFRFKAPTRMRKSGLPRKSKGELRFCRDQADIDAKCLFERMFTSLAEIHKHHHGRRPMLPVLPPMAVKQAHFFWLDNEYQHGQRSMSCGGMLGQCQLSLPDDPMWASVVVMASWLGIGQNRSFGLGRFEWRLEEHTYPPKSYPAKNWLRRIAQTQYVHQALAKTNYLPQYKMPSVERIISYIKQIERGQYTVPLLQGEVLQKEGKAPRPLAKPPLHDKIVQRVFQQALKDSLDALMYKRSYGYRSGRSRLNAATDIQQAAKEGYRWVFESDIASYFDTVSRDRIEQRLMGLFNDEALVASLIMWMQAPVVFQDKIIERPKGIPQGSPLSPLLANLLLDDFDNDMQAHGFRLVRFADDFIVMCKSQKQAEQAKLIAEQSLNEHELKLNLNKTTITTLEKGFHFLGYLFVGDLLFQSPHRSDGKVKPPPPHSWLAEYQRQYDPVKVTEEVSNTPLSLAPPSIDTVALEQNLLPAADSLPENAELPIPLDEQHTDTWGKRQWQGTMLCITGSPSIVHCYQQRLMVTRGKDTLVNQAFDAIAGVILFGHHQITSYALQKLLTLGIAVHHATAMGRYLGVSRGPLPDSGKQALWQKQMQLDEDTCLTIAITLVKARVLHCKMILRKRNHSAHIKLGEIAKQITHANNMMQLRGYEGIASQWYFAAYRDMLPDWMGFDQRQRRPPPDPANALLSLGYTLLYGYSDSMLRSTGLLPWQGVYHQAKGRHAALASDLMEPFRHLVERTVLSMVHRKQLSPEDFSQQSDNKCEISANARKRYLQSLISTLETPVLAKGAEQAEAIHEHLYQQALSLVNKCHQQGEFKVWRVN